MAGVIFTSEKEASDIIIEIASVLTFNNFM